VVLFVWLAMSMKRNHFFDSEQRNRPSSNSQ
jgi:hypothetical protein